MKYGGLAVLGGLPGSLPSRGAWIEIAGEIVAEGKALVAPLTGSVD